uniref:Uncharacterized protein n=1 Tax=Electrophorus electricus TaxID=8005 RepID=A0A4W4F8C4_ELEEL
GMAFGPRLSNRLLLSLTGHKSVVRDLVFAPNGTLTLVSASRDKTLRIWDLSKKGAPCRVLTGPNYWVFKCSVSPDSSMIASVCNLDSVSISDHLLKMHIHA